jgi:hypothetical protein
MKALLCSCASLVSVSKVSCTTERRAFFVTRTVLGKCQEVAGNVTAKILRYVKSAGIGRSWLCVGQGQGVFERKRKT